MPKAKNPITEEERSRRFVVELASLSSLSDFFPKPPALLVRR